MGHRNGPWNEEMPFCKGSQPRVVMGEKTETEHSESPNSIGRDVLEADGVTDSIKAALCEGCVKLMAATLRKERRACRPGRPKPRSAESREN